MRKKSYCWKYGTLGIPGRIWLSDWDAGQRASNTGHPVLYGMDGNPSSQSLIYVVISVSSQVLVYLAISDVSSQLVVYIMWSLSGDRYLFTLCDLCQLIGNCLYRLIYVSSHILVYITSSRTVQMYLFKLREFCAVTSLYYTQSEYLSCQLAGLTCSHVCSAHAWPYDCIA